jgi:hypothetical protein
VKLQDINGGGVLCSTPVPSLKNKTKSKRETTKKEEPKSPLPGQRVDIKKKKNLSKNIS